MKKILFLLFAAGLMLTSCEKEKAGGTATEKTAGQWYVTVTAVDEAGETVYEDEDLFGLGHFVLLTYNTNSNVNTEMWVDDDENFWEFKVKVDLDYNAGTFSTKDFVENQTYESGVKISDGKILFGAATTPSGSPADSIVFYVDFDDDPYPSAYGYANYKISGFRYTGLAGDD